MITFDYTLTDPMGLHARPAGLLVKEAKKYDSHITVTAKGQTVDLLRLMAVMRLGTKAGDTVTFNVEGDDEIKASEELQSFLKENV